MFQRAPSSSPPASKPLRSSCHAIRTSPVPRAVIAGKRLLEPTGACETSRRGDHVAPSSVERAEIHPLNAVLRVVRVVQDVHGARIVDASAICAPQYAHPPQPQSGGALETSTTFVVQVVPSVDDLETKRLTSPDGLPLASKPAQGEERGAVRRDCAALGSDQPSFEFVFARSDTSTRSCHHRARRRRRSSSRRCRRDRRTVPARRGCPCRSPARGTRPERASTSVRSRRIGRRTGWTCRPS